MSGLYLHIPFLTFHRSVDLQWIPHLVLMVGLATSSVDRNSNAQRT